MSNVNILNLEAGEDFTGKDHIFVKYNGSGKIVACSAGDTTCIGILQAASPKKGESGPVAIDGNCRVKLGETVAAGDFLTIGANSKAVVGNASVDGCYVGAQAQEAGTAGQLISVKVVGVNTTDSDDAAATPELDNLTTTAVNKDLTFAKYRSQSTYQGVTVQLSEEDIIFTITPDGEDPFLFPFTFEAANTYEQNRDALVAAFIALPAAISAGFIAYPSGAAGEWNYSGVTYTNQFFFKGPLAVDFTVTNDNAPCIDVYAPNDQAASSTAPGTVTNLSEPEDDQDAATKLYVDTATGGGFTSVEVLLTFASDVPETVSDLITSASSVTMRLRKIGDVVICSVNAFDLASFAGTNGEYLRSPVAIPAAYRPVDDDTLSFPCTLQAPAQFGVFSVFEDGHVGFFAEADFTGFLNASNVKTVTTTASWITGANDA